MGARFEMLERDGASRIARLTTPHGDIETPALLPVVNPNVRTLSMEEMRRAGASAIITNAYIIMRKPDLRKEAERCGLHTLLGWDGPIMTDSGTFQTHVYGADVSIDPGTILDLQVRIGSDICTILDVFTEPHADERTASQQAGLTVQRARDALHVGRGGGSILACPIQGALHPRIRERCASELSELGAEYLPIGGVVPLLESYRFADLVSVILASRRGADPSAPLHLFGCGHPMLFSLAVLLGCDIFDSASYVKYAKQDRLLTPGGTVHLDNLRYSGCRCDTCTRFTPEEMRALPREEKVHRLALHNLSAMFDEIERVKQAVHSESIWEHTMMRVRAHPDLYAVVHGMRSWYDELEPCEPLYRRTALMYTGEETLHRPCVRRFRARLKERYVLPECEAECILPEPPRPYRASLRDALQRYPSVHFSVRSWMGVIPLELDTLYPVSQCIVPPWTGPLDPADEHIPPDADIPVSTSFEDLKDVVSASGGRKLDRDVLTVRAITTFQFGRRCAELLTLPPLRFVRSANRDRIRNVISRGEHVFSLRAGDGFVSLRPEGARRILPVGEWQVVAADEAAEFVRMGRNLFAKFVVDCDPQIRPRDEVVIVDEKGGLLATGQAAMNRREMLAFECGVAVRVRRRTSSKDEMDNPDGTGSIAQHPQGDMRTGRQAGGPRGG